MEFPLWKLQLLFMVLGNLRLSMGQNGDSAQDFPWIFTLISFCLAIIGMLKKKKHGTKISLQAVLGLAFTSLADVSFASLGTFLDYLVKVVGRKKFCVLALLIPSGNRLGIVQGWLLHMIFSPTGTSYVFRWALLLPAFGTPATMWLIDEPINELMVDPVWAGVPVLTYLVTWLLLESPQSALSLFSSLWVYRWWAVNIGTVCWVNRSLVYLVVTGLFWLLWKPVSLLWDFLISSELEKWGNIISARIRRAQSYESTFPNKRDPYCYKSLLEEDHIRLLRLWPRVPGEEVRCELARMQLDVAQSQNYEAMSYTWGTSGETHTITLEGHHFPVTENVYNLLCDHSSSWKYKFLWIDSICINQKDNTEKSGQIMLMKEIYKRAKRAVVYLGTDTDSRLAVNLIKELRMLVFYDMTNKDIFLKYSSELSSQRWIALMKMLSHPWFERVWIIQEVVMASHVVINYGNTLLEWNSLVRAVRLLSSDDSKRLLRSIDGDIPMMQSALVKLANIEMLARSREEREKGVSQPFQDIMFRYCGFKATDPHDKVFALLGCISNTENLPFHQQRLIRPDYNLSVQEVYINSANFIASSNDPSLLLAHAGVGCERKIGGMPSWVPDWTSVDGPATLGGPNCDFRASGYSSFSMRNGPIPNSKVIRVILPDFIKILGSPSRLPTDLEAKTEDNREGFLSRDTQSVMNNRRFYRWVLEAQNLAFTCGMTHYDRRNEDKSEVFWRTLVGDLRVWGPRPTPETYTEYKQSYEDWIAIHAAFDEHEISLNDMTASGPTSLALNETLKARFGDGTAIDDRYLNTTQWLSKANLVTSWRRFCVTEFGYFGLVPPGTREGDLVAVVEGMNTLYIVRLNSTAEDGFVRDGVRYYETTYELVGECFIFGGMDAELYGEQWVADCTIV